MVSKCPFCSSLIPFSFQFEELLAAATSISKEQDQDLKQRADRARKEDDRKRKDEERRQKAKKEAQAAILKLREEEEKRRKAAFQKQKLVKEQREQEALRRQKQQLHYRKPTANSDRKSTGKQSVRQTFIPDRPKTVHQDLSFDEIMKKANEVPTDKKALSVQRKYQPPAPEPAARPKLHIKDPIRKQPASMSASSKSSSMYASKYQHGGGAGMGGSAGSKPASVRDRIKNMALAPPQKLNMNKRDMRSVEEIQQDVRRKLGKPVPEERRPRENDRPLERRPMRPAPTAAAARRPLPSPAGRPDTSRPVARRRSPPRMPFRSNRPRPSRRYSDEDEYDEDLDGFIDDDDVEEEGNDYSDVISKMFRYDRKR